MKARSILGGKDSANLYIYDSIRVEPMDATVALFSGADSRDGVQ
jgi:hypothetical protein